MKLRRVGALITAFAVVFSSLGLYAQPTEVKAADKKTVIASNNFENNVIAPWESKDGATVSIVSEERHGGSYSLKVSGRSATWEGTKMKLNNPKEGQTVEISSYVKYTQGPNKKNIMISLAISGVGDTEYLTVANVELTKGQWGAINGSIVLPKGIEQENADLYFETPYTNEQNATNDLMNFYVDDITVSVSEPEDVTLYPSLKELYKDEFYIGVATPAHILSNSTYTKLINHEFNSMTMENEMKPDYVFDFNTSRSNLSKYNERAALNFNNYRIGLDYAKANGIKMRGHTLVWHSQTPKWFFYENYDVNGKLASRDLMLKRMENYINDVIYWTETNYPGVIYAWDVVNEAIADPWGIAEAGQPSPLRPAGTKDGESMWHLTIGGDFIQKAFEYARKYTRQYAPNRTIKLFYNDYNEYFEQKRDGIIQALKPIKAAGNIDGVGMQSHIDVNWDLYSSYNGYMTAVKKFHDELGVEIHVTELDVGMTDPSHNEENQGAFYQEFMEGLLQQKKNGVNITCVTFWGLTDALTWRPGTNCLLFREDLSRKPAFDGVVNAISPAIIKNGGFESGLTNWIAYDDGQIAIDKNTVYEGKQSVKLSGRTKTSSGICQDITGKVERGKVYEVTARVRYQAGAGTDNATAYDTTNFNICIFYGPYYVNGQSIEVMATGSTGKDNWGVIKGSYAIPDYADLSQVRIFIETGFAASPNAQDLITYYVDDVAMYKVGELNQEVIDSVIAKINEIGNVVYSQTCKDKIDAARSAYDNLGAEYKALVSNYSTLTSAETAYNGIVKKIESVIEAIAGIGEVTYSPESKSKIDAAEAAYATLTEAEKAAVTNAGTLTAAKVQYENKKSEYEGTESDAAIARAVIEKINAIGQVTYTDACKAKIDAAREAYDRLTSAQILLVINDYMTLLQAEMDYNELKNAAEQQVIKDKEKADAVIGLIQNLGTITGSNESKNKIDAAREAYDKLTSDQQKLVTNYFDLILAEFEYSEAIKNQGDTPGTGDTQKPEGPQNPESPQNPNDTPNQGGGQNSGNTNGSGNTSNQGNTQNQGNAAALKDSGIYLVGDFNYKVTNLAKKTVSVVNTVKKAKTITIANTVTINGVSFKITAIEKNAFINNKKVTTVKIGKNVTTIGASAFAGCKKLKSVKISSSKMKSVGKKAFKGTVKKIKMDVPNKKVKAYKKLFSKSGLSKSATVK